MRPAERVEVLHGEHAVVHQSDHGHLLAVHQGRGTALGEQIRQAADGEPGGLRRRALRRGDDLLHAHLRTSRVVPAMRTAESDRSAGVAGRACPRSATYASEGSGVVGALTKEANRRTFSGSSSVAFHSSS